MAPKKKKITKGKGCLSEEFKASIREMTLASPYVLERLSSQDLELQGIDRKGKEKNAKKIKKKSSERKRFIFSFLLAMKFF